MAVKKQGEKLVTLKTDDSGKRYGKNGEYDAQAAQDLVTAMRDKGYQPTKEEQAVIDAYIADTAANTKSDDARVETKAKAAQPKDAKANAAGQLDLPDLSEGEASGVSDVGKGEDNTRTAMERAGAQAQNVGMTIRTGIKGKIADSDEYQGKAVSDMPFRNPRYDMTSNKNDAELYEAGVAQNRELLKISKEVADLKKAYPDYAEEIDKAIDDWDGAGVGGISGSRGAVQLINNLIAKFARRGNKDGTGGRASVNEDNAPPNAKASDGKDGNTSGGAAGGKSLTIDDVRKMTPDEYQAGPSAAQVVQVMKDAGLSKEEAIKELARLSSTSKTGAISQIGMGALNSIYGAARDEGGADNGAQAQGASEPSRTPIRDEVIANDESGALGGMQQAREGIAEELLANADDPKLREALTNYVEEVKRNYQDVEPKTRRLVYMNMFDAYSKGLWGDPKSDDPQERKEAKLGLTFAILGQLGKIMSQFGKDMGKMAGLDIGGEIGNTAFDTIQQKSIEQAMNERQQYIQGKLTAEMDAAGFGPELQAQALDTFTKWKNNPDTMPLAEALKGQRQLYAFQMSQILGDKLMSNPTVAQLVGLMALGQIDGEAVKAVLVTRMGQEIVGILKDWAEKNPNGLFSGFIGNVAGKAASIIGN